MPITWHAVDLKTGRRGQQLTVAKGSAGALSRKIGEATDVSGLAVACKLDGVPVPGWDEATLGGRMMLVACDELDVPVWGGFVNRRRATLTSSWVTLDLVTLEGYLDRRYVRDHTFVATPQGAIVSGVLVADAIPSGVAFVVDASSSTLRDRTYADDEDKTVLSVLQELMGVEGGPEFTVDLEWADADHTVLNRIVRVRDRLGTASTQPVTRFEMPGNVVDGEYVEDFSSEFGANDVLATSSGEGDQRPTSAHQVATDLLANGWATFEDRFSPSTSITDTATLDAHARARLALRRDGQATLTLEVDVSGGWPLPGRDFWLGDDVAVSLTCARFPERVDADGALAPGYVKVVRCIGTSVDYEAGRLVPTLLEVG